MSDGENPGREFCGGRSARQRRPAADGEPPLNQKSRWDDLRPRRELTPLPAAVEADFTGGCASSPAAVSCASPPRSIRAPVRPGR
jgi:hypothetical protein